MFSILGWVGITMVLIYLVMGITDPLTKSQQGQTFKYLDRSILNRHFDNPRADESYKTSDHDFQVLYRDMNERGFDPLHPMSVVPARDPKTHKRLNNGRYDVVCGNRRLAVADELMIDRIPCNIFENLSYEEELDSLMDHISVKGLNKKEILEAYRKLAVAGYTREKIAAKLDLKTRNGKLAVLKVDELADICQLPTAIQEEWLDEKKPAGEKTVKPTGENLKTLTDAIAADRVGGHLGKVEDGPLFQAAKMKIGSIKKESSDYGSKKALRAVATAEKLSNVVRNLFYILSGDTQAPLGEILDVVRWMEQETMGTLSGVDRPAMVDKIMGTDSGPETTDSGPETTDSGPESEAAESEAAESEAAEPESELMTADSAPTPRRKRK